MGHPAVILEEPVLIGDSVRFYAHVRNYAGALTDPASAAFIVYNSKEEEVDVLQAFREAEGQYFTDWQTEMDQPRGWYWVEFVGLIGPDTHRKRVKFQVMFG